MTKKTKSIEKVKESFIAWNKDKDIAEFIKERMGLKPEGKNETHAEQLIDNMILKAKNEDKPEWTGLLLKSIETTKENKVTNVNVFAQIAESTNQGIDKLVDVTPKNKQEFFDII